MRQLAFKILCKIRKFSLRIILLKQFLISGGIYSVHKILYFTSENYSHCLVRRYLADFLALIFCIPIFVNSQILLGARKRRRLGILEVLSYATLFSLYFEIIGPKFLPHFTADLFDILAYFLGGFCLYFSQFLAILSDDV